MQSECYHYISAAETRRRRKFTCMMVARADGVLMPGISLTMVAHHAFTHLMRSRVPSLLVPDSEDSGGYNDRIAFMNRCAPGRRGCNGCRERWGRGVQ